MVKYIRYSMLVIGSLIILYGFIRDEDLITFVGCFVLVMGLMLNTFLKKRIK